MDGIFKAIKFQSSRLTKDFLLMLLAQNDISR